MKLAYDVTLPSIVNTMDLPPVILIHGMLESRLSWKNICKDIAERTGRKVYTGDARNHGDSPWTDEMNFDLLVEDLDTFITYHNIPKALLVGFSFGGRIALIYASKKPHKVEKLFLEDVALEDVYLDKKVVRIQLSKIRKITDLMKSIPGDLDESEVKEGIMNYFRSRQGPGSEKGSFDVDTLPIVRRGDHYEWKTNTAVMERLLTSDAVNNSIFDLPGIFEGDVLFLYGAQSHYKPSGDEFRRIQKVCPRAVKVEIDEANHYIHHMFPEKFCDLLVEFILNGSDLKSKY